MLHTHKDINLLNAVHYQLFNTNTNMNNSSWDQWLEIIHVSLAPLKAKLEMIHPQRIAWLIVSQYYCSKCSFFLSCWCIVIKLSEVPLSITVWWLCSFIFPQSILIAACEVDNMILPWHKRKQNVRCHKMYPRLSSHKGEKSKF